MSQFIEMFGNQNTNDKQWTESLVKDEFKLSMGKTPARSNPECWENGMHRWISISDMATFTRYTGDTSEYITDYAITDSGIKAVPKGTIIMSFKLSIGRTAITSEDIYTNEAIMAFADFDEKKFNIDFLHFLIANKNWLLGAKQAVKGQTLNKESIGNAKIIIPPIEMQEKFASIYNQADKSEFVGFKSQFIEMFGDYEMTANFGDFFSYARNGANIKQGTVSGGIPITRIETISEGVVNREKMGYAGIVDNTYSSYYLQDGDILVSHINSMKHIGKCALYQHINNETIIHGMNLLCLRPNKDIVKPQYVMYLLRSNIMRELILDITKPAVNQASFTIKDLCKLKVMLSPISEQEEFVSIVEQADKSEYYN